MTAPSTPEGEDLDPMRDDDGSAWPWRYLPARRDRFVLWLASHVMALATPRTRARIRVALIRSQGLEPPPWLLTKAQLSREPGA